MKELKIKTQAENEIDIKDIDIRKHLVIWKGEVSNYILIKHIDKYMFKDIAHIGGAIGGHDSINKIMNESDAQKALKNGEIKIYEI